MEEKRQKYIGDWWDKASRDDLRRKFDHLEGFLPPDFESILDVGGGIGAMHDSISRWKKHSYVLVDGSRGSVEASKRAGIRAIQCDLDSEPLPFEDNSFDLVCATDLLEHVRDPWIVLAEMARVSRKYVFIYGPNGGRAGSRSF